MSVLKQCEYSVIFAVSCAYAFDQLRPILLPSADLSVL